MVKSSISIHALRVEGDENGIVYLGHHILISIHALRVEGDELAKATVNLDLISIHALRVEGDEMDQVGEAMADISIHALRVEGDPGQSLHPAGRRDFNPRPPCGGRLTSSSYRTD